MNQNEINNIQLVLAGILSDNDEPKVRMTNGLYGNYSAVSVMYANMIEKEIYSIDKVPKKYIEEVDSILSKNKED